MTIYCHNLRFLSFSVMTLIIIVEIKKPIIKPKLGIKTYPNPPPPEKIGKPISPSAIYVTVARVDAFNGRASPVSKTKNVCKVIGIIFGIGSRINEPTQIKVQNSADNVNVTIKFLLFILTSH